MSADTNSNAVQAIVDALMLAVNTKLADYDKTVSAKLKNIKIDGKQILPGTVMTTALGTGAINSRTIADGAISNGKFAAGAIQVADIEAAVQDVCKNITIDAAQVRNLEVTTAQITDLVAHDAQVFSANIKKASIDLAQVGSITADTFFVAEAIGDKILIKNLMVNEAAIASLTAGTILIAGKDGDMYELAVESDGSVGATKKYTVGNVNIGTNIDASKLADGTVVGGKIAQGTIEGKNIATGTITANLIGANEILAKHIVGEAIDASKIKSHSITAGQIEGGTITAEEIATHTITADRIKASTITANELAADVGKSLKLESNESITMLVNKFDEDGNAKSAAGVKTTRVTVDGDGVKMKTGGAISMEAGSSLNMTGGENSIAMADGNLDMNGGNLTLTGESSLLMKSGSALKMEAGSNLEMSAGSSLTLTVDENNSISMSKDGLSMVGGNITMAGGSSLTLDSGGSVRLSAENTEDSVINFGDVFSVNQEEGGGISGKRAVFENVEITSGLKINGSRALTVNDLDTKIVFSETQPEGHDILWMFPSGTDKGEETTAGTSARKTYSTSETGGWEYTDVTKTFTVTSGNTEGMQDNTEYTYTVSGCIKGLRYVYESRWVEDKDGTWSREDYGYSSSLGEPMQIAVVCELSNGTSTITFDRVLVNVPSSGVSDTFAAVVTTGVNLCASEGRTLTLTVSISKMAERNSDGTWGDKRVYYTTREYLRNKYNSDDGKNRQEVTYYFSGTTTVLAEATGAALIASDGTKAKPVLVTTYYIP